MDHRATHASFVEVTGCDAGLASDLLAGKQWNWDAALDYYYQIYGNDPDQKQRSTNAPINAPTQSGPAPNSTPPTRQSPTPNQSASSPPKRFQKLQPLPEHKVVQPTPSPTATVTSSVSNPSLMSSSLASSGGRNPDVKSSQSSDLKLLIPKPEDNIQKSPTPTRKLERGISNANVTLVEFSRNRVTEDEQDHDHYLVDTPMYTFILPDLTLFPADFRAFMERDLLELSTMANLENAGRLNWWAESNACSRLWPMATTGDGNCLLHAASLGMWGFHDRQLTLRKALYHTLTQNPRSPRMQRLKRRWQLEQMEVNQKSGLVYSEEEWDQEWKALLRLASPEPRTLTPGGSRSPLPPLTENKPPTPTDTSEEHTYESLEEFHVFVLAHILRRPIIVVSDTLLRDADGEAFAPISFGGIYLPLEVPFKDCQMSPLVLTYDTAHFSALVPMEQDLEDYDPAKRNVTALPVVIPVTDCEHRLLPVHFAVDPGPNWKCTSSSSSKSGHQHHKTLSTADKLKLLNQYLNFTKIPTSSRAKGVDLREREGALSSNSLTGNAGGSSLQPDGGDKMRVDRGSFGRKLKYFTKIEKNKNGGSSSADRNTPVNEKKAGTITLGELEDPTIIVGAGMSERRHQFQEEMIKNYITKAKERFEEDCKQKRATKRQLQEVMGKSGLSPPLRSWDDSHIKSRDPTSQGFRRQEHGYLNRQPSPETYRRYNQDPGYLNAQQNPLTQTRSNPIPQAQPQYHPQLLSPLNDPRPAGYQFGYQQQYGYQLGAPAEATFYANQINVPQQRQTRSHEDRPATVGQLVQGIHQLQPASVYQQMPAQPVPQPNRSPQIVRSSPAFPTNNSMQVPRSPQPSRTSQAPPLTQPLKAKSGDPKNTKTKSKDKISKPCKTKGCDFYGTDSTNFLCSHCYEVKIANSKSGRK